VSMRLVLVFICALALVNGQCPELNVNNIVSHLDQLDLIAQANSGNRAAGSSGYQASLGYILSQLSNTQLVVRVQDFTFEGFAIIGTPIFSKNQPDSKNYVYNVDFRVMSGSGSGVLNTQPVHNVPNVGCDVNDYTSFPSGALAVVLRGTCTFTIKANLARGAGASAIIIVNNNNGPSFSGAIETILPAYGVSAAVGLDLTNTARVSVDVKTLKENLVTSNIIAETPSAQTQNVIVVGSHLDSVPAGAGINDNGSGSATNLELALTFDKCLPNAVNKIRFAWWGAEELGLLGSQFYVNDLVNNNPGELARIALNLNFDMVGSPNFFYGIYNGSGAAPIIRNRCVQIQRQFEASIGNMGEPYDLTPFSGRSDYGPFIENGVAAGGLFSGAEEIKDAAGRTKYKGLANTAYDPCYHAYCDSFENINVEGLTVLSTAAYQVTEHFANTAFVTQPTIKPGQKYHILNPHPDAILQY